MRNHFLAERHYQKMKPPLVSVIIPAYNASDYLSEAIDSALAQTYTNIEIIVVNDGSEDDGATERIALSYDDKIRYYHKENGGCASALNYGITVMCGEYFSWLSHDDLYLPNRTKTLVDELYSHGFDEKMTVMACDGIQINADGEIVFTPFKQTCGLLSPEKAFAETMLVKTFNGCGLLIPKCILDNVGDFLCEYKHLLDRELWMRIALYGASYYVVGKPLVRSRVHGKQVTVEQQSLLYKEEETLINEYFDRTLAKKEAPGFVMSLCEFSYKRRHYTLGKQILQKAKAAGMCSSCDVIRVYIYMLKGIIRRPIGKLYKKIIRRSTH